MEKKELVQKSVKELKAVAKKNNISIPTGYLKDDIIKLLLRASKVSKKNTNETIVKKVKFSEPLEQNMKIKSQIEQRSVQQKLNVKATVSVEQAKKIGKYTVIKQLGSKGKEGTTFLVENKKGGKFALKLFSKTKAVSTLVKEGHYQKMVAKHGLAPKVVEINEEEKYILMELMDKNLFDIMKKNNGVLSDSVQKKIVKVITKMDDTGVFHGDPNPANFMLTGGKMYMIDYGFAKDIDGKLMKKHNTKTPNRKFMILGLLLKIKEIYREHNPNIEYNVLSKMLEN